MPQSGSLRRVAGVGVVLTLLFAASASAAPNFVQEWAKNSSCAAVVPPGTPVTPVFQKGVQAKPGENVAEGGGYKIKYHVDEAKKQVVSWQITEPGAPINPGVRVAYAIYKLPNGSFVGQLNYYEPDQGSGDDSAGFSFEGAESLRTITFCIANFPVATQAGDCPQDDCTFQDGDYEDNWAGRSWVTVTSRDGTVNQACSCNFASVVCAVGPGSGDVNLPPCVPEGQPLTDTVNQSETWRNTATCRGPSTGGGSAGCKKPTK